MLSFHSLDHTVFYSIYFANTILFFFKVYPFKKVSDSKTRVGRDYCLITITFPMSRRMFDTFKNAINMF